jgi:glycosyltransferase involved in cell wall biosynthesis
MHFMRRHISRHSNASVAPPWCCRGAAAGLSERVIPAAHGRPHLLCVGGEDHHLRIPFLLGLRRRGLRIAAAGTGNPAPFERAGLDYWPIHFNRFISPAKDRVTIRQLRKVLRAAQPHIVQSFDTKPNVLVPWAARDFPGIRVVRTINGMGWVYSSRSPLALILRPVQRALHRRAARWSDATIFQNRQDKEYFEQNGLIAPDRAVLIPGSGIDLDGFDRAISEGQTPAQLRDALGLGDAEVVITVTRLTRQKGIPALLNAAAIVRKVRPGVRFVLVGPRESEGPLAVTHAEIQRHAPYVLATGSRSDVPALLRMADVFVFPTEYREGVPRALLEAALVGLPLIATNMPGCDEVVRDGWSGRLVTPGAPRELAAAIIDLLAHRAAGRAMGARAAETVRGQFGLDLTVERYCDVYRRFLAPPPSLSPSSAEAMPPVRYPRERYRESDHFSGFHPLCPS